MALCLPSISFVCFVSIRIWSKWNSIRLLWNKSPKKKKTSSWSKMMMSMMMMMTMMIYSDHNSSIYQRCVSKKKTQLHLKKYNQRFWMLNESCWLVNDCFNPTFISLFFFFNLDEIFSKKKNFSPKNHLTFQNKDLMKQKKK